MSSESKMPDFVRRLCTHNPFYLISACLVLYGLEVVFRPRLETPAVTVLSLLVPVLLRIGICDALLGAASPNIRERDSVQ